MLWPSYNGRIGRPKTMLMAFLWGKIILQFAQPSAVYLDLINETDVFPTYFSELAMVTGDVSPTLVGQIGPR